VETLNGRPGLCVAVKVCLCRLSLQPKGCTPDLSVTQNSAAAAAVCHLWRYTYVCFVAVCDEREDDHKQAGGEPHEKSGPGDPRDAEAATENVDRVRAGNRATETETCRRTVVLHEEFLRFKQLPRRAVCSP